MSNEEKYKMQKKLNAAEKSILEVYNSDHCRHTTFNTQITDIKVNGDAIFKRQVENALDIYKKQRKETNGENKPISLMNLATIGAKYQKLKGNAKNLVEYPDEQNAATMRTIVNGVSYDLSFKNETHNSPTGVVPFDGAATAFGGALRDIFANRATPYMGMRLTGRGDVTKKHNVKDRLDQDYLTLEAAKGYADFAKKNNLAVGHLHEIYHDGYIAKPLELGWVAGFVKTSDVRVEKPVAGDIVFLIGAPTGRDGIGSAVESSSQQAKDALRTMSTQVPKGNPELAYRIFKLYSDPKFLALVKRCNDFGAGGVSVAIGELTPGIDIFLDKVPLRKGQEDMTPVEIAISESQERMAIVADKNDAQKVLELTKKYGLDATHVANVTNGKSMNMYFNDKLIVSLDRDFIEKAAINTNTQKVVVNAPNNAVLKNKKYNSFRELVLGTVGDIENASRQGLANMFPQIGEFTAIPAYDGKTKKTPTQGCANFVPVKGNKSVVSIGTMGYDAIISEWSPYYGGCAARLDSLAKFIVLGGNYKNAFLTDQEYFATPSTPEKFGNPFQALLGANEVNYAMGVASVGGKDSMSGTFQGLDVPPALVSFAFGTADAKNVKSQAFQKAGNDVGIIFVPHDDLSAVKNGWDYFIKERDKGNIVSSRVFGTGGMILEIANAALGNEIGFKFNNSAWNVSFDNLAQKNYGSLIFEIKKGAKLDTNCVKVIGQTMADKSIQFGNDKVTLGEILKASEGRLASVFPIKA